MSRKTRLRTNVTPKAQLKMRFVMVTVGVGIAALVGVMSFFYFNLGRVDEAVAASYNSTQTGAWTDGATWSGGSAPGVTDINGDNIVINSGDSVTRSGDLSVKNNTSFNINSNADLVIDGNLTVKNNLILNVDGNLVITGDVITQNGAAITVNGGGNVEINGSANFGQNTDFTVDGTLTVDEGISFGNNSTFDGGGTVNVGGSGCGEWTGTGDCTDNTTLPVELLSFEARYVRGIVQVTWATATELNNDYFTLERSEEGMTFSKVTTVQGQGTTNSVSTYQVEDEHPLSGKSYYRLVQTDFDGTTETFRPVLVYGDGEGNNLSVYPNPLKGNIVNIDLPDAAKGEIQILDLKGNFVFGQQLEGWDKNVSLTLPPNLSSGIYLVKLTSGNTNKITRLVKN